LKSGADKPHNGASAKIYVCGEFEHRKAARQGFGLPALSTAHKIPWPRFLSYLNGLMPFKYDRRFFAAANYWSRRTTEPRVRHCETKARSDVL
jgi:hypothetical protein